MTSVVTEADRKKARAILKGGLWAYVDFHNDEERLDAETTIARALADQRNQIADYAQHLAPVVAKGIRSSEYLTTGDQP